MKHRGSIVLAAAVAAVIARAASAAPNVTISEPFDGTLDEASWRVDASSGTIVVEEIQAAGGHPDAFLYAELLNAIPRITTVPTDLSLPFRGNYRARGVVSAGIDLEFLAGDSLAGGSVALFLHSDMGTPADPSDDCVATTSKNLPKGAGWKAIDVKVPAQETTIPGGWGLAGACGGLPGNLAWNALIQNVTAVTFQLSAEGTWHLGFDNPRIMLGSGGTGPS